MQLRTIITTLIFIAWPMQPVLADAELAAFASEARLEIVPRDEIRTIRLPRIDFSVRAEFECPDEAVAESVTISVADAYQRYAPNDADNSFDAVITVPANQIAPIAAGDFCANGDNENEELLLSGIATAQLSLRCLAEGIRSVNFASLKLPLRLVCRTDLGQDPSASVPPPAR